MKIAYILEEFPSPTEHFILNEILQFEQNNFEITLLVLNRQKQFENLSELKKLRANILYLPKSHYYFPVLQFLFSPRSFFRFYPLKPRRDRIPISKYPVLFVQMLRNIRYYGISQYFLNKNIQCDHIHAHFAFISVDVAYYLSTLLKVNYSLSAHAQDIYTNQNKIIQHLPSLQFLITCTEYNKNYINKLTNNNFMSKIHLVYHGTNQDKWCQGEISNNNINTLQILTVARLVEKKGLIYLIKALEKLLDNDIKANCVIIGEGPLQSKLEKYLNSKELNNFIKIIPFVSQNKLREYYLMADVFILPCIIGADGDRDGLPNVIVESMLTGVAVISTPVSAIPEVIKHKETGILVKDKDENAIAEGVKLLMNNKKLRQYIINNARKEVKKKFDIQSSTEQLLNIFRAIGPFSN